MNTNTDFIIHEPAESYHFRSRSGEYMSSHLLADFRESPALYYKEISGQIDPKESAAFTLGRAAHSLILEGRHAFDRDYIVCNGPVNPSAAVATGLEKVSVRCNPKERQCQRMFKLPHNWT